MANESKYQSLDDAVQGLESFEREFFANKDRRAVFATTYLAFTRVIIAWAQDGRFEAKGDGGQRGQRGRSPSQAPNLREWPQPEPMPRQARVVAAGVPHHITHRGNNRQEVFLTDEDRRRYQQLLFRSLEPCGAELLGWCWMSNHVHLIVVPRREDSLSRLIRRVHSVYAQGFNRRRSRDGHLWRSRFYSCVLGPNRLETALLYVDLNPVRAGMNRRGGRLGVVKRPRARQRPGRDGPAGG